MAKHGKLGKVRDGLVQRAEGRWSYIVRVPDERTGKNRQKWISRDDQGRPFPTRAAAKAARDKAQHELNQGSYVLPSQQTLGELLTHWLDDLARTTDAKKARRPSTISNYRTIVEAYVLRWPIASCELRKLDKRRLEAHWDDIAQTGGKGGRPLSQSTVGYAHTLVKSALQAAVDEGTLPRNPAKLVKPHRVEHTSDDDERAERAWTAEQLQVFLDATSSDRLGALWQLLAATGMRRGEALALRWEDVDDDAGTAQVRRTLSFGLEGQVIVSDSTKTRKRRTVPLNDAARRALQSQRKLQAQEQLQAGAAWRGNPRGYVFTTLDGELTHPQAATRAFRAAVRKLDELPQITLHGIRHTVATLLLSSGQPVHMVAQVLGHDPNVLLSTYAHLLETDSRRVVDSLDVLLAG